LQYIDAWKGFMGELEKMTPAAPIFVSESSTGSPALFVGVYYKSWAEMDTGAASLQKALASAAYGRLTMATQEAVESSRWDILKFRPELSNPPDEVIAADPAFWKPAPPAAPKPKMAAAEKK
jgi:hypothetical protein